jgi:hypothetical protein
MLSLNRAFLAFQPMSQKVDSKRNILEAVLETLLHRGTGLNGIQMLVIVKDIKGTK